MVSGVQVRTTYVAISPTTGLHLRPATAREKAAYLRENAKRPLTREGAVKVGRVLIVTYTGPGESHIPGRFRPAVRRDSAYSLNDKAVNALLWIGSTGGTKGYGMSPNYTGAERLVKLGLARHNPGRREQYKLTSNGIIAYEFYRSGRQKAGGRDPASGGASRRYPPYPHGKSKIRKVMTEFEAGKLRSSSGKRVTSLAQARAIALSEQRRKEHIRDRGGRVPSLALQKVYADWEYARMQFHRAPRREQEMWMKRIQALGTKIAQMEKKELRHRCVRDCSCMMSHTHSKTRGNPPARRDAGRCHTGTEVQTVVLSHQFFNERQALSWVRRHGFVATKIDDTPNNYRFRQKPPTHFQEGSFRTIRLRPGVEAVIACPR